MGVPGREKFKAKRTTLNPVNARENAHTDQANHAAARRLTSPPSRPSCLARPVTTTKPHRLTLFVPCLSPCTLLSPARCLLQCPPSETRGHPGRTVARKPGGPSQDKGRA